MKGCSGAKKLDSYDSSHTFCLKGQSDVRSIVAAVAEPSGVSTDL